MRVFQGLFSFIIVLLVLALVVVFPIAKVVGAQLLDERFYTERLDDIGVYDEVYDGLIENIDMRVNDVVKKETWTLTRRRG